MLCLPRFAAQWQENRLQRQSGVTHVVAERIEDVSQILDDLVHLHEPARAADGP